MVKADEGMSDNTKFLFFFSFRSYNDYCFKIFLYRKIISTKLEMIVILNTVIHNTCSISVSFTRTPLTLLVWKRQRYNDVVDINVLRSVIPL